MSIDYFIHKKDKRNKIQKAEMESSLDKDLVIDNVQTDDVGDVVFFTAKLKESPFLEGYEYNLQDDGNYWTYTYNYEPEDFAEFQEIITKVAESLNMFIDNPQTGKSNLLPKDIPNDPMDKILETQRKVIKNMPDILKQVGMEVVSTKTDLELYEDNLDVLAKKYATQGLYVDNILHGVKDDKVEYFCSWVVTVPTVIPPVDKVIVMDKASEDSKVYIVPIDTLKNIIGNGFETNADPVLHYILPAITEQAVLNRIFEAGTRLQ